MQEKTALQSAEYARLAVDVAADKLAADILMLDIRGVASFADFFVILSTESQRQLAAVAGDIEEALEGQGAVLHHREGTQDSGWVLLDFGDVIVHIFGAEEREYYQLERLWGQAQEVVRVL